MSREMSREAAQTTRHVDCCDLENRWRAASFVVREGLPLETMPSLDAFVMIMFPTCNFVLALVLPMPCLKKPIVAYYDFKSCTNNLTCREVAQTT